MAQFASPGITKNNWNTDLMLPCNQDISIAYAGASGGFYLLHQLLLAGHHWARFLIPDQQLQTWISELTHSQRNQLRATREIYYYYSQSHWPSYPEYFKGADQLNDDLRTACHSMALEEPVNLDDIEGQWPRILEWVVDHQWQITNPRHWKRNEILVNNQHPIPEKEYLYYQNLPQQYHRVRFSCCNFPGDFNAFWDEMPGYKVLLYTDSESQQALSRYKCAGRMPQTEDTMIYNSHKVFNILKDQFDRVDQVIYLQDFVNNQPQFLGPMNPAQQALKQRWLNLHPPELLASIGINH